MSYCDKIGSKYNPDYNLCFKAEEHFLILFETNKLYKR